MIRFDPSLFDGSPGATIVLNSQLAVNGKTLSIDASILPKGVTIDGGGSGRVLFVDSGSTVVLHSLMITGGRSAANGGGVSTEGFLEIYNSTIFGNETLGLTDSGGINRQGGSLTITNSTITGNSAGDEGGAISSFGSGSLTIDQCTISGNRSQDRAGGIYAFQGTTNIRNSIVAGNFGTTGRDIWNGSTIVPTGSNLIGSNDSAGGEFLAGPLVGTPSAPLDPKLGPLAYYGGATWTMPLLVDSKAIDAGGATSLSTDQRGFSRVVAGVSPSGANVLPDIGAYEAGRVFLVTNAANLASQLTNANAPGDRLLFNLPSSSELALTSTLEVPDTRTVFLDASSLVDGNGVRRLENDPFNAGSMIVPSGVTLSGRTVFNPGDSTLGLHSLTITGSTTGGIVNEGSLTLASSTVFENSRSFAAGIYNNGGALTTIDSTVSGNISSDAVPGLYSSGGSLRMENCTVANNQAGERAGALWFDSGATATICHSTIAGNLAGTVSGSQPAAGIFVAGTSGTVTLENTLVADNITGARPGGSNTPLDIGGNITTIGANLVEVHGSGTATGPAPIADNAELAPLADYGGPTETVMLLAGSKAIDAGVPSVRTPLFDQRRQTRILAGGLDLGAYEAGAGSFDRSGLTVYARVDQALTIQGVKIEISRDRNFLPTVTTVAGIALAPGAEDGPRATSQFHYPSGVAKDSAGNLFVADTANNQIRMIDPTGEVTTIAGSGDYGFLDGPGDSAQFALPAGVALDGDEDLYVSDTFNHTIRKLTRPAIPGLPWTVSTLAGDGIAGALNGAGTVARFSHPHGLVVNSAGNILVADSVNAQIRQVTPAGVVSTWYSGAVLGGPTGLALHSNGDLWVADPDKHQIFRSTGVGSMISRAGSTAGFSNVSTGRFNRPVGLAFDHADNLYVADQNNHAIRKLVLNGSGTAVNAVSTVAGLFPASSGSTDGNSTVAQFNCPAALLVDLQGDPSDPTVNLIVADAHNHLIRRIAVDPIRVDADLGTEDFSGIAASAVLDVTALGLDPDKPYYTRWVANSGLGEPAILGQSFVLVDPPVVTTDPLLNGDLTSTTAQLRGTVNPNKSTTEVSFEYSTDPNMATPLRVSTLVGGDLRSFRGVVEDGAGNVFVANAAAGAHQILKFNATGQLVANGTYGEGPSGFLDDSRTLGRFDHPAGLALDGNTLYVADEFNHRIRMINLGTGAISTYAGNGVAGFADGTGAATGSAQFLYPRDVAVDSAGNVYVADSGNHRIRKIEAGTQIVTTVAGSGTLGFADGPAGTAQFNNPSGVAVSSDDAVHVADTGNHRIRLLTPGGTVVMVAGSGTEGTVDGSGAAAQFASPTGLAIDPDGTIFVADRDNHCVRRVANTGEVSTLAGSGVAGLLDSPVGELYPATTTRFNQPRGIALNTDGELFVCQEGRYALQFESVVTAGALPTEGTSLAVVALVGADLHVRIFDDQGDLVIDKPEAELVAGQKLTDLKATLNAVPFPDEASLSDQDQQEAVRCARSIAGYAHSALRVISRDLLPTVAVSPNLTGSSAQGVSATTTIPLLPGGTYYYRAVAVNGRDDTIRGAILSFVTPQSEIVIHKGGSTADPTLTPGETIDFGTTPFNTPKEQTFTIENIGTSPLVISNVTISGPNSGGFTMQTNPLPESIPASASTTFDVTLEHGSAASFQGEIVVTSNDQDEDTISFSVSGEVVAAPDLSNVAHADVSATGVTFSATVDPQGSATEVAFEFSKFAGFTGTLEVRTKSGSTQGFANGCGAGAQFNTPGDVAADQFGNVFVADTLNHRIRKVTVNGDCTVLAGSGVAGYADGTGAAAHFNAPEGIAVDQFGNVYVADTLNHRIRKITPAGEVTTVAGFGGAAFTDGIASAARFHTPTGIDVDLTGTIYVADSLNSRVRKIANGLVSTLFEGSNLMNDVAVDPAGNVFAAEYFSTGPQTIVYGFRSDGNLSCIFDCPAEEITGLAADSLGNVYATYGSNHTIFSARGDTEFGGVAIAGVAGVPGADDGEAAFALFDTPSGITVSPSGTIFIADQGNHRIRQIEPAARTIVAAAGITGTSAQNVETIVEGLDPDTLYYYRALASNAGGTVYSPLAAPYPTFTTLDNAAALVGLTVDGVPVPDFDPCVYSYAVPLAPARAPLVATAESADATIRIYQDGIFLREVQSGLETVLTDLKAGNNFFQIEVISKDSTQSRTYIINIVRQLTGFGSWQAANFGGDAGNPAIASPSADPSLDEVDNLQKYAFYLDPTVNSTAGLPVTGQGPGTLTLTYTKVLAATDLTYEVQCSTDLSNWIPAGGAEQVLTDDGTTQQILATVPAGGGPRKFLRLKLTLQP